MTASYELTTKAVNSKQLLKDIQELEIIFTDFGVNWTSDTQRMAAIDTVDDVMAHLYEQGRITQWKVVSDFRNNKIVDMDQGIYYLTITFKQAHCLNTTTLEYKIDASEPELDFELEF
jgi:hypothetical protein